MVKRPNNDTTIPLFHRRNLETTDGLSLTSKFLLIPINITPTHWILLIRKHDVTSGTVTYSHDLQGIPLNLTDTQAQLQRYDTLLALTEGFTNVLIRHIPAVVQYDEYSCGVCLLTTALIYLYHPHSTHFP